MKTRYQKDCKRRNRKMLAYLRRIAGDLGLKCARYIAAGDERRAAAEACAAATCAHIALEGELEEKPWR